jgi:hypothetical protein
MQQWQLCACQLHTKVVTRVGSVGPSLGPHNECLVGHVTAAVAVAAVCIAAVTGCCCCSCELCKVKGLVDGEPAPRQLCGVGVVGPSALTQAGMDGGSKSAR